MLGSQVWVRVVIDGLIRRIKWIDHEFEGKWKQKHHNIGSERLIVGWACRITFFGPCQCHMTRRCRMTENELIMTRKVKTQELYDAG